MTREEYIRERLRKRKIITYTIRACVLLLAVGTIGLIFCGCLYAADLGNEEDPVTLSSDAPQHNALADEELSGVAGSSEVLSTEVLSSEVISSEADSSEAPSSQPVASSEEADSSVCDGDGEYDDEGILVVLDAGHGGNDSGTFSGEIYEKNITLAVVMLMKEKLESHGVEVFLTRTSDKYVGLETRTDTANAENPDLFVSIHCNSYEADDSVHGMECYYQKSGTDSQTYAELIMEEIGKYSSEVKNRGAREEDYHVTRCSECPAVLIEMGFMSNPEECAKLNSSEYQEFLAEKLVDGILAGIEEVEILR